VGGENSPERRNFLQSSNALLVNLPAGNCR
jgi:hypothetical protein